MMTAVAIMVWPSWSRQSSCKDIITPSVLGPKPAYQDPDVLSGGGLMLFANGLPHPALSTAVGRSCVLIGMRLLVQRALEQHPAPASCQLQSKHSLFLFNLFSLLPYLLILSYLIRSTRQLCQQ
jgi:hypothetical protein